MYVSPLMIIVIFYFICYACDCKCCDKKDEGSEDDYEYEES